MTGEAVFRPLTPVLRRRLTDWLAEYVAEPHPELGRPGAVCPFVRPAQRAHCLELVRVRWPADGDVAQLVRLTQRLMDRFEARLPQSPNPALASVICVFDGMRPESYHLVDEAHARIKGAAVARGMMLGQLHPDCPAAAARNPAFPVNRAPVPMMAVRRMAFHDILFLHRDPVWFETYRARFGSHYLAAHRVEPELVRLFDSGALLAAGGSFC
ncbi:DUF6875 domain-containing protein [Streptomyces lonarensis]|uniref:DUF6875 domain-containing protein n=1 Tax=Streptomyces lonarensis TaxID=700599 RepID=A0A7X6D5N6_9ACTN|nr:hypothetical protein [Streptomyces lonarensis]NJQ08642.1 hypothetical protein [Streptomyces lonarensis]